MLKFTSELFNFTERQYRFNFKYITETWMNLQLQSKVMSVHSRRFLSLMIYHKTSGIVMGTLTPSVHKGAPEYQY